jgi:hypothetical protein
MAQNHPLLNPVHVDNEVVTHLGDLAIPTSRMSTTLNAMVEHNEEAATNLSEITSRYIV